MEGLERIDENHEDAVTDQDYCEVTYDSFMERNDIAVENDDQTTSDEFDSDYGELVTKIEIVDDMKTELNLEDNV